MSEVVGWWWRWWFVGGSGHQSSSIQGVWLGHPTALWTAPRAGQPGSLEAQTAVGEGLSRQPSPVLQPEGEPAGAHLLAREALGGLCDQQLPDQVFSFRANLQHAVGMSWDGLGWVGLVWVGGI